MTTSSQDGEGRSWLELEDAFDEELELEMDDGRIPAVLRNLHDGHRKSSIDRPTYFRELRRLQSELVKVQDWVIHNGLKVVVLFEGGATVRARAG